MERESRRLTLTLLIFEATDGETTLTDDVTNRFAGPFQGSAWHSKVRKIAGAGSAGGTGGTTGSTASSVIPSHYELQLVHRTLATGYGPAVQQETRAAIETLCQDFCDPEGALSPRRINPNPTIIFTVAVDPNNPTDETFLETFVKHSVQNTNGRVDLGLKDPAPSSITQVVSFGAPFKGILQSLPGALAGDQNDLVVVAGLVPAVLQLMPHILQENNAEHRALTEQTMASIDMAMSSFGELENCTRSSAQLQSAKQHLGHLRDAMSALARQHEGAKDQQQSALKTQRLLLLTAVATLVTVLLVPTVGTALADTAPAAAQFITRGWDGCVELWRLAIRDKGGDGQKDEQALRKTDESIHRWLFVMLLDVLGSDYRHHPGPAGVAKLAMEMAAVVEPEALAGWDYRTSTRETQNRYLKDLLEHWTRSAAGPPST
ncbi:hypothetical protein C8A01DRAFT_36685 [Parachaetomium inaequale]|uniref:Uncharacterized protein n=1 Tax=Parachaetomium inaequale TaxID=2588326 RepID=A0AAN6SQG5_9PEZI|nr:hypothetical protein C8A01DRAFT_36685 [Parachaetomium inaequale]